MTLPTLALVFVVGALVGAVGVGGFLLVPVLVFLEGRPVREAVIVATVSFLGSGIVSLAVWMRGRRDAAGHASFLAAAAPGAVVGALLLRVAGGRTIAIVIAAAVGLAGLAELGGWPRARERHDARAGSAIRGAITGMASALTGTSGPLVAMPLLAWSGVPIVERIRIGQVAQLPIAACAAAVFLGAGDIAWSAAAACALVLAAGTLAGMRVTTRVEPPVLRRVSAALMLLTAASMLASAVL